MKKLPIILLLIFSLCTSVYSQETIKVWNSGDPPISYDIYDEAELTVYLPKTKNDTLKSPVVLIFPGGGYAGVSMPYEGHAFAKWLQKDGFAAIILKYRLPHENKEIPFDDAKESLKIIQNNAAKWNLNLEKLGIAGFSAGGHLASIFSNWLVNQSDVVQPAFNILFYPVISFEQVTKGGTRNNLLGLDPPAELIRQFSAQLQVSSRTPKTIIFVSDNDESVPSTHSTMYYDALKDNNIAAAMYVFPIGGHGWGMLDGFEYNKLALSLLEKWLVQFK